MFDKLLSRLLSLFMEKALAQSARIRVALASAIMALCAKYGLPEAVGQVVVEVVTVLGGVLVLGLSHRDVTAKPGE